MSQFDFEAAPRRGFRDGPTSLRDGARARSSRPPGVRWLSTSCFRYPCASRPRPVPPRNAQGNRPRGPVRAAGISTAGRGCGKILAGVLRECVPEDFTPAPRLGLQPGDFAEWLRVQLRETHRWSQWIVGRAVHLRNRDTPKRPVLVNGMNFAADLREQGEVAIGGKRRPAASPSHLP